jgi:hypothetical protein
MRRLVNLLKRGVSLQNLDQEIQGVLLDKLLLEAQAHFPICVLTRAAGWHEVVLVGEEGAAEIEDRVRRTIPNPFAGVGYQGCLPRVLQGLDLRGWLQTRIVPAVSTRGPELDLQVQGQAALSTTAARLSTAALGEVESAEEYVERLLGLFCFHLEGKGGILKLGC